LISGTSGIGKSTIVKNLSNKIKNDNNDLWVVSIILRHYTKQFKDYKSEINEIDFLSKSLLGHDCLEHNIFEYFITVKRVVIFFDGFDEICPDYQMVVLTFIKLLEKNNIKQIWLTSRVMYTQKLGLEKFFNVKSFQIRKISKEEQTNFFNNLGKNLIDNLFNNISDDLLAIPLHLRMSAELCGINMPKFNLSRLYEKFIEKKCEFYFEEKLQVDLTRIEFKNLLEIYLDDFIIKHQKLAILSLFAIDDFDILFSKVERNKILSDYSDGKITAEIIESIVDDKPIFIHTNFAYYFSALYFSKNLDKGYVREFFINNVLIYQNHFAIRNFFSYQLLREKESLGDFCSTMNAKEYSYILKILEVAVVDYLFHHNTRYYVFLKNKLKYKPEDLHKIENLVSTNYIN